MIYLVYKNKDRKWTITEMSSDPQIKYVVSRKQ